jgi:hypothetical protein
LKSPVRRFPNALEENPVGYFCASLIGAILLLSSLSHTVYGP